MQQSVHAINRSVHRTNEWLKDLSLELGLDNSEAAYDSLRAVLHSVRDRLPPDQAVNLGDQLPLVVRGVYYESWKPSRTPEKIRHPELFADRVREELPSDVLRERADEVTRATLALLSRELNPEAMEKFRQSFPQEVRELWPSSGQIH